MFSLKPILLEFTYLESSTFIFLREKICAWKYQILMLILGFEHKPIILNNVKGRETFLSSIVLEQSVFLCTLQLSKYPTFVISLNICDR